MSIAYSIFQSAPQTADADTMVEWMKTLELFKSKILEHKRQETEDGVIHMFYFSDHSFIEFTLFEDGTVDLVEGMWRDPIVGEHPESKTIN